MNLGQYVTDLISLSNRLQKEAANTSDPLKLYETTSEIKDVAKCLQSHLVSEYWAKGKKIGETSA